MKTYRVNENKRFRVEDRDFIFLPEDNAIFELTPNIKECLEYGVFLEEFSRNELFPGIKGTDKEKSELFEELARCRVLRESGNGNPSAPGDRPTSEIQLKSLVLQLTDACNLRCTYCYYAHGAPSLKSPTNMTFDVAESAVDFLFDHSGNFKDVTLVFFGGEPLLRFDLMAHIVTYSGNRAVSEGKKINFALTTNATLLTEPIVRFLNDNNIGITVSMDGFKESHDRYRRFPGGESSYEVILPNIRRLLASFDQKPVPARVTVAADSSDLLKMLTHLLHLGFSEAGFAPVTTTDNRFQLSPEKMDDLLVQFKKLSSQFLGFALKGEFFGFTNIIDLLVELHEGEVKQYPCGAGLGLLSVGTGGDLYLCQRLVGEKAAYMGDIFSGIDTDNNRNFRIAVDKNRAGTCKNCWVRNICAGGCYHEALIREGTLTAANTHYCEWIKNWIETGITVYARLALNHPEYLDRLSGLRGRGAV